MKTIKVNGIGINLRDEGSGFPLILIHGIGMDHTQWDINGHFDRLSEKFRTIAYDCRGHGLSEKITGYLLNDHIDDVFAVADHLKLEKFHLYGVSMGSYIAQGAAIRQPGRIVKLVLVVPKSNGLTSSVARIMKEHADELSKMSDEQKESFFARFIAYNPETALKNPSLFRSPLPADCLHAANKALEGFDFRNDLGRITAKTLVISGRHDGLNPPAEGRICAESIKDSSFIEMQLSGHIPMIEEPERYYSVVHKFLDEEA